MIAHFFLKFSSSFGETLFVSGNHEIIGNDHLEYALPLTYLNKDYWYGRIEFPDNPVEISYKYLLKDAKGLLIIEGERDRKFSFIKDKITLIDTWNHAGEIKNVFYTLPFTETLLASPKSPNTIDTSLTKFVDFKIKAPVLEKNECVCIIGKGGLLGDWSTEKPILLSYDAPWYTTRINLSLEAFPIKYKFGIWNRKENSFKSFEGGEDRILSKSMFDKTNITIIHETFYDRPSFWRGAGVAIPVFSLRSKDSFGTGEFTDLKLLVDWAKITGLKLIQLLPINDTTAHHSAQDSYPYAAISAFALHPLYINLSKIGGSECSQIVKAYSKKQKQLNELPDLDYEQVMKFKMSILKELYAVCKSKITKDADYVNFVEENRNWLKAYAAFCYFRDKNNTSNFNSWKFNSIYDEAAIDKLLLTKNAEEIKFHYFVQYHLHIQLLDAVKYAHENHIILKGDIPIGVYRNGCDAWMNPELFHMDQQSGAPPDDFAIKGQNWGFPTYNWNKMQQDDFSWWKSRFQQMNRYFDAFRIDHILGFFRIWSIPLSAVQGILGKFSPAIAVGINEFYDRHINFDRDRFCNPFITDYLVDQIFNDLSAEIKDQYLDRQENGLYKLKEQFSDQRKIERYFEEQENESKAFITSGLNDLLSNVILIEDEINPQNQFHFRIAMEQTNSFQSLDDYTKSQLKELYINYFYKRQNELWKREAMNKLPALKAGTDMLICGEDLGMVPDCVPDVMSQLGILSLEIQRMPKDPKVEFFHPKDAPYLSVVTPSTHDMSTIRGWWEEDSEKTQRFYHFILGHYGQAPATCEANLNKEIVIQHLYSPAMWSVFQLQDILGIDGEIRRPNPAEERINQPADSNHYWRYRMHLLLEDLLKQKEFNNGLKDLVVKSSRA